VHNCTSAEINMHYAFSQNRRSYAESGVLFRKRPLADLPRDARGESTGERERKGVSERSGERGEERVKAEESGGKAKRVLLASHCFHRRSFFEGAHRLPGWLAGSRSSFLLRKGEGESP